MFISIVSPVYRSEAIVTELITRIHKTVSSLTFDYEIILVDDGSPDESWLRISSHCLHDKKVKGVKLSRNFGQHYAVTAGLSVACGKLTVVMDCDLQDDPANIPLLIAEYEKGNEVVFTKRIQRKHSLRKKVFSALYNFLFGLFSERSYDVNVGSMVLFSDIVRDNLLRIQDKDRLYIQMLKWVGFKSTYVSVQHHSRFAGTSSYTLIKLLRLALQGWTSHSDKLLKLSIYGGFLLSLVTFIISLIILVRYFTDGFLPGWPSLIIAIMFSTGLILMSVGVAGIYIGKIFDQTKNRPLFIIDKMINLE